MGDIANCDMVCDILLEDNVDYHSKARIWNDSDPNHIVTFHEFGTLQFVFVIRKRCCELRHIVFPNLKVGWASGFDGI